MGRDRHGVGLASSLSARFEHSFSQRHPAALVEPALANEEEVEKSGAGPAVEPEESSALLLQRVHRGNTVRKQIAAGYRHMRLVEEANAADAPMKVVEVRLAVAGATEDADIQAKMARLERENFIQSKRIRELETKLLEQAAQHLGQ